MSHRTEKHTREVQVTVVVCDHCAASAETPAQAAGYICCHQLVQNQAASLLAALTGSAEAAGAAPPADKHLCGKCWAELAPFFAPPTPVPVSPRENEAVH